MPRSEHLFSLSSRVPRRTVRRMNIKPIREKTPAMVREGELLARAVAYWCDLVDQLGLELSAATIGAPDEDQRWAELAEAVGMQRVWDLRLYLTGIALSDSGTPAADFMATMADTI